MHVARGRGAVLSKRWFIFETMAGTAGDLLLVENGHDVEGALTKLLDFQNRLQSQGKSVCEWLGDPSEVRIPLRIEDWLKYRSRVTVDNTLPIGIEIHG